MRSNDQFERTVGRAQAAGHLSGESSTRVLRERRLDDAALAQAPKEGRIVLDRRFERSMAHRAETRAAAEPPDDLCARAYFRAVGERHTGSGITWQMLAQVEHELAATCTALTDAAAEGNLLRQSLDFTAPRTKSVVDMMRVLRHRARPS
jgi:hypothetical protein